MTKSDNVIRFPRPYARADGMFIINVPYNRGHWGGSEMLPTELQAWCERMNFTHPVAAKKLSVSLSTFNDWLNDVRSISKPAAKLMRELDQ